MSEETAVSIADRLLTSNSGWSKEYGGSNISWINDDLDYELELWVLDLEAEDYGLDSAFISNDKLDLIIDITHSDLGEFNVFKFTDELNSKMTINPNRDNDEVNSHVKVLGIPTGEFDFSLETFEDVITKTLL